MSPERNQPNTLFISLVPPAESYISQECWDLDCDVSVRGTRVEADQAPWVPDADLLIAPDSREFVGVTFGVFPEVHWGPTRALVATLNPEVVRYNDISTREGMERYPGQKGYEHRCEIVWVERSHVVIEWAQLMFGDWEWLYLPGDGLGFHRRPVAFQITGIREILLRHNLVFPELEHPRLDVRLNA